MEQRVPVLGSGFKPFYTLVKMSGFYSRTYLSSSMLKRPVELLSHVQHAPHHSFRGIWLAPNLNCPNRVNLN